MADNEDLQEFIDEYVSDVISSAITEVSMTTDSGVDEGCDDSEVTQLAVSSYYSPPPPPPPHPQTPTPTPRWVLCIGARGTAPEECFLNNRSQHNDSGVDEGCDDNLKLPS